jgi:large-conductance mechanosensitive channel
MINFLLNENILAIAPVCGFFTTHMLLSLKNHILDPFAHKLFPADFFGELSDPNNPSVNKINANINWKLFLKDLILWIIVMFVFYIIWAKLLKRSPH